jgi:OmcA/MtrC family decaheme c-type cytochrome
VRYPRERTGCVACHLDGSELLPLVSNLASTVDPRGFFNPAPPNTGACLSCHENLSTAAHADVNTSPIYGESCDVCHGQGAQFAVDKSHAK